MSPWLAFGIVLGGLTLAAIARRIRGHWRQAGGDLEALTGATREEPEVRP